MKKLKEILKGDTVLWMMVFILSFISLLSVYSSSGSTEDSVKDVAKHFMILLFSFGIIYISHLLPYTFFYKIAPLALLLSFVLIILTIFFGKTINDATRTLEIPIINLSFQTSDFAKIALIIYLARLLAKNQENIKDFKKTFLPLMMPILLMCLLISYSNLSTALFIFASSITLIFIGRVDVKQLGGTILIGVVLFAMLLMVGKSYPDLLPRLSTWNKRIESFTNKKEIPKEEYTQENIAKIAIADGGVFGVAPGRSKQRNTLANASSDFIYAIIVEEYGLLGGIFVMLLYLIILYRAIRIATKTPRFFGSLLVFGCSFLIMFQAFIIFGYTVGLLPTTGLPLPLISMGGTSLWFTAFNMGIILSVSRELENTQTETQDATV